MKATFSLLTMMIIFVGFTLVGDALAQPNPPEAAGESSGGDSAADEEKAPAPTEEQPSTDTEGEKAKDGEETEAASGKAEEAEPPAGVVDQAKGLYSAVKGGKWVMAFALLAMLLGSIGRFLFARKWKFWKTKKGGYVIAGVTGLALLGAGLAPLRS